MSYFKFKDVYGTWILLGLIFIAWLYFALFVNTSLYGFGGGDNISHYLISRYAFAHPCLFFHHWGKPLFTVLSAPFAQFGLYGVYVFNLLVSVLAVFFAFKTTVILNHKNAKMVLVFAAFSPVYFFTVPTALTEPLFSFILIAGIFLFAQKKYCLSATVLSFIILVRTESFILFPIFITAFAISKQWKAIPLLASGFLIFSLAGMGCYDSIFWLINRNPYSLNDSIYGHGTWYYFIINSDSIFGIPQLLMLLTGMIYSVFKYINKRNSVNLHERLVFFLLSGSVIVFFTAHSYVWWKGIGNSLGLIRVMASIIPAAAVIALTGMNFITEKLFFHKKIAKSVFILVLMVTSILSPFLLKGFPFVPFHDEELVVESTNWLKSNSLSKGKVYYFNPLIPYLLKNDPWEKSEVVNLVEVAKYGDVNWQNGDVLFWDAHFGPNEGGVKLDTLLHSDKWQLEMYFKPEYPFKVLGENDYEIYIFVRGNYAKSSYQYDLEEVKTNMMKKRFQISVPIQNIEFSDNSLDPNSRVSIPDSEVFVEQGTEFFPFIEIPYSVITKSKFRYIYLSVTISNPQNTSEIFMVFSLEKAEKNYKYVAEPVNFTVLKTQNSYEISKFISLPENLKDKTTLKCYLWNKGGQNSFIMNDVEILLLK